MIGVLSQRASANRAWLVMDQSVEGDLLLAIVTHDVAPRAGWDGDTRGDLITDWTDELQLQLLLHWVF